MKKIFVAVQAKDVQETLENLGDLGIVHIEPLEAPKLQMTAQLVEDVDALREAVDAISFKENAPQERNSNGEGIVSEILQLTAEINRCRQDIEKRQAEIQEWEPWGNFNPKDIEALASSGFYVYLCEISKKDKTQIPADTVVQTLSSEKKMVRIVLVSRQPLQLPFAIEQLPPLSLTQMKELLQIDQADLEKAQKKLANYFKYREQLEALLKEKEESLKLQEIRAGMKEDQGVVVLKGFSPAESCAKLEQKTRESHWGLWVADPDAEDRVPTYIRNPHWVKIIEPVFGVINVIPGYKEFDISLVFLIFFSMFFGILIGDAAYGLVLLSLAAFMQYKLKNKIVDPRPFYLMYVLSMCAIIWGALTGTFLGTVLLGKYVKPVLTWLTDLRNVQLFCFLLGVIHLSVAHTWKFLIKIPSLSALAEMGSICILWGGFFVANMLILGIPLMGFVKYLFIIGSICMLIDIFTQPKETIFVNIILFVFGIINAFTDVVSYVRLFAVGLAGVAVADAFNEMALGVGFNNVLSGIMTAFILIAGHLFNIILSGFGVLVHGLRLNVLEFSGHLGLEWAGIKYEPFRRNKKSLITV